MVSRGFAPRRRRQSRPGQERGDRPKGPEETHQARNVRARGCRSLLKLGPRFDGLTAFPARFGIHEPRETGLRRPLAPSHVRGGVAFSFPPSPLWMRVCLKVHGMQGVFVEAKCGLNLRTTIRRRGGDQIRLSDQLQPSGTRKVVVGAPIVGCIAVQKRGSGLPGRSRYCAIPRTTWRNRSTISVASNEPRSSTVPGH